MKYGMDMDKNTHPTKKNEWKFHKKTMACWSRWIVLNRMQAVKFNRTATEANKKMAFLILKPDKINKSQLRM